MLLEELHEVIKGNVLFVLSDFFQCDFQLLTQLELIAQDLLDFRR